jgi:hypothetical protein
MAVMYGRAPWKQEYFVSADQLHFNTLSTKLYMSYLRTHFLLRSKHSLT